MSTNGQFLVGSVLERKPQGVAVPPRPMNTGSHGFPLVQHRSKSAFARSRETTRKSTPGTRSRDPPTVVPSQTTPAKAATFEPDSWREQMSRENEARLADMTDEEREAEKKEILQRFGAGIGDVLKRAKQAREQDPTKERWPTQKRKPPPPSDADSEESFRNLEEVPISGDEPAPSRSSERGFSPPPALSRPDSRPASRADRKLRFAGLGPSDVHVYESAPPSPKKQPLALPPALNDGSAISLGQWHGKMASASDHQSPPSTSPQPEVSTDAGEQEGPEEGTAEYIRQRYFPSAPANDPNLAWMQASGHSIQRSAAPRFDLHGDVIPPSDVATLPTHLGLHHHAEGSMAGYTLDDILLLSRSTVPAQRATMLGVLAHIVIKIGKAREGKFSDVNELVPEAGEVQKRVMAAGVEAMGERGNVGTRAIEVVWASVVGWDEGAINWEGVELQQSSDVAIASLPFDFFLPQIATLLSQGDIAPESLKQLLAILRRLSQQSNRIAENITQTPKLLTGILQTFLLTPIPPRESEPLPEPVALQLLITLASASRVNARELMGYTDALLRFVTPLPPSSPFPAALATSLLTLTLQLYTTLARYGFYSHIATTAMEQFSQLGHYVLSPKCTSQKLKMAWLDLLTAWIVCAVDPHKTTPEHDILWSQVIGWGWKDDFAQAAEGLGDCEDDWRVWGAVWNAQAQLLEGSKVNGVKGGEAERVEFIEAVKHDFHDGTRGKVVVLVVDALERDLGAIEAPMNLSNAALHGGVLTAAIRLWLACLPPHLEGAPPSPPFELPFPRISEICAKLVTHSLWDTLNDGKVDPHSYTHARQLSGLLATYLALSSRLPGVSEELWIAQAFSILLRLLPGDEDAAVTVVEEMIRLLIPERLDQRHIAYPTVIWEKGGLSILQPFLSNAILPDRDSRIAPLQITPKSIASSSTLRSPMASRRPSFGVPLHRDWPFIPMNHLLRSADSEALKHLPPGWDSTEVEVVRATLMFSRVSRDSLTSFALHQFALSREEAVFGCMRVFMLEHGQPQNDSGEVFRDAVVEKLMNQILEPYTYHAPRKAPARMPKAETNLEQVAARFLGGSTPFFQFYTDFVALYDAISFSNPIFSTLLLPPISMRYSLDYRKHFWDDFGHIVRTVRTPCEQVLSADLKEYLYPVESDPQLIGAYLRALLKDTMQGFVRLVALHHIAASIWPDLRNEETSSATRASKLIKAVATQGNIQVVRDVATYRQSSLEPTCVPPECFANVANVAEDRLKWLRSLGDEAVVSRLEGLLIQAP